MKKDTNLGESGIIYHSLPKLFKYARLFVI